MLSVAGVNALVTCTVTSDEDDNRDEMFERADEDVFSREPPAMCMN